MKVGKERDRDKLEMSGIAPNLRIGGWWEGE
jgi:hypothetical protein